MDEEQAQEQHGILTWLDSWRLATAFAVVFSILMGLWSIKLTSDTRHLTESNRELATKVAIEIAKRRETEITSNQNQVTTCFERNASSPGLIDLLEAIKPVVSDNAKAAAAINNYIALLSENVPSKAACTALARKLGVALPKERKQSS